MVNPRYLLTLALIGLGCSRSETPAPPPTTVEPGLDARAVLVRASLDVRGVRPTAGELDAVLADPAQLDPIVDAMVDDPRFEHRVRALFAPALRTRRDVFQFNAATYGLEEESQLRFVRAIAEEGLNLIAYVAVADRPFSEVLTADYTIVDPILIGPWPLVETPDQPAELREGTVMARYHDPRPAAGVLSTNSFYWRHTSTVDNANRGRANAVARALLCEDYLERPIDFPTDVDLTNDDAIRDAINDNPGCTACHATLDPLASHLWGFMFLNEDVITWSTYQPQNERLWEERTQAVPAFFGVPTSGRLNGLGADIASDPRFVSCTVKRIYEGMLGREATVGDDGQLAKHREAFLEEGLSLKALVRSVLKDPAYRGRTQISQWGGRPEGVDLKLASPEQLSTSVEALTGYRLSVFGVNMTEIDFAVRALAGGSERGPTSTPSLGHTIVHRRLAEGAAAVLIEGGAAPSPLVERLAGVDMSTEPSPELIVDLIADTRSERVAVDHADVASLLTLWRDLSSSSTEAAWRGLLTALIADPTLALY